MWIMRISGNVIGVSFRATTQSIAQQLGYTGSVSNMPDHTVEITLDGPRSHAETLVKELKSCWFYKHRHHRNCRKTSLNRLFFL